MKAQFFGCHFNFRAPTAANNAEMTADVAANDGDIDEMTGDSQAIDAHGQTIDPDGQEIASDTRWSRARRNFASTLFKK